MKALKGVSFLTISQPIFLGFYWSESQNEQVLVIMHTKEP